VVQKNSSGWKQEHPPRGTSKQRRSKLIFQRTDLSTHRRLRDVKPLGGATDITFLGDSYEITKLRETHWLSVP
jgi:hypothetical protein